MPTQSGLIRADSQIPHSRQQTHRNVRQVGYTLQTHQVTTFASSFGPQFRFLTPPARLALCACLHVVKPARSPAAKYRVIPNNYTTEGGLFLRSGSMKPIIVYLCVPPHTHTKTKCIFIHCMPVTATHTRSCLFSQLKCW